MGQRTGITETLRPAAPAPDPTPTPDPYPAPTTAAAPPRPVIPQTRSITYTYDGLQRLTGATETPGTTYDYTYDLAGNRTEVRENDALVADLSYNDANQVIGWSYDAAGNLLSDGASTRSYDALNRLVAHDSTSYTYNGDGVLVSDGTTTYVQDLAAPLSQVLSDGTATYVYGHERLRAQGGPWYVGDALGSVRQTLDDAGAVLATTNYDPWGTPQGTLSAPFGFTGELHHPGQVYLRARWYVPGTGTFPSRDPFAGFATRPYSLHPYQYGYSAPTTWTDPSGKLPYSQCTDPNSRTCPLFSDGWVAAHQAEILGAATLHAKPAQGFDTNTLAVLMGAILIIENNYNEVLGGRRIRGDIAGFSHPSYRRPTTGVGNISIATAVQALTGQLRVVEGIAFDEANNPSFQYIELCTALTSAPETMAYVQDLVTTYRTLPPFLYGPPEPAVKAAVFTALQNVEVNLDIMATILEQGIVAASVITVQPTLFNLATWYNGGVQHLDQIEIRGPGVIGYGNFIVRNLDRAARALGLGDASFIPTATRYSPEEEVFIVDNFGVIEQAP
jgi:RHS repeat-associated protein